VDSIASLGSLERARAKMNENSASGEPTAEERADWEELKRAWFEPSAGVGINTTGAWISSGAAAANSMIAGRDAIIAEMRRSGGAVARKEDAFEAELRRFHMEREEQLALREKKKLAADVKARDAHASAVVNRNLLLLL
uniref:hypothetical protein n=1 Tax=Roseateles sp. TaxID=1971397 RepID=UPI003BA70E5D